MRLFGHSHAALAAPSHEGIGRERWGQGADRDVDVNLVSSIC